MTHRPLVLLLLSAATWAGALSLGAGLSRRAAVLGVATLPFAWREAALAESDEDRQAIIERAQAKSLKIDKAISRARVEDLFDPEGVSCSLIDEVIGVDKKALQQELEQLRILETVAAQGDEVSKPQLKELKQITARFQKQVLFLEQAQDKQGCLDAFVTYDRDAVLARASKGDLGVERVLQRAKMDKMVDTKGKFSCDELANLITIDGNALKRQELEVKLLTETLQGTSDPATKKIFAEVQKIDKNLGAQISALNKKAQAQSCNIK